jgi:hypothetical protein
LKASKQDLVATGTVSEEKAATMNRKAARGWTKVVKGHRSGTRTGTTAHFAAWQAEGKVKSILQKTKTVAIADGLPSAENGAATGFALLSVGGFKTVWDVSQATEADLLAVKGVGIVRLGFVHDYLTRKGVALAWSVNA